MQYELSSRNLILAAIFLGPIGSLRQCQVALPLAALVVQGGLEGVLPLEPFLCLTSLLLMQRLCSAVLVQLSQRACLQKKSTRTQANHR